MLAHPLVSPIQPEETNTAMPKKAEEKEEVVAEEVLAPELPVEEVEVATAPVSGDREARWEAFLESAKKQNPVKFAVKEKAGEFKKIPDTFK